MEAKERPQAALKPCPFCGLEDAHISAYHVDTDAGGKWVAVCRCGGCGAQVDAPQPSRWAACDLAAEIWNTRNGVLS